MTYVTLEFIKLVAKETVVSTMNNQKHFIRKDEHTAVYPYLLRAEEPTKEEVKDRNKQWFELQHDIHCSDFVEDNTQSREIIMGGSEIVRYDKLFQLISDGEIQDGDVFIGFFTVVNGTYEFSGISTTADANIELTEREHKSANLIASLYLI